MHIQTHALQRYLNNTTTIIGVSVLYVLCVQLHIFILPQITLGVPFHPWIGIALAILLINIRRYLPGVFLGTVFIHIFSNVNVIEAISLAACTTLAVAIGAFLILSKGRFNLKLHSLRDYASLILMGGMVTGSASAIAKTVLAFSNDGLAGQGVFHYFSQCLVSDFLGVAFLSPLALLFWRHLVKNGESIQRDVQAKISNEQNFDTACNEPTSIDHAETCRTHLISELFANSKEALIILDANFTLLFANKAYLELTGKLEDHIFGKNILELYEQDISKEVLQEISCSLHHHDYWKGEVWRRRTNGDHYLESLSISKVVDRLSKQTLYLCILSGVSINDAVKQSHEWLEHFDSLTGLPGRKLLEKCAIQAISTSRSKSQELTLLYLDLDKFKNINDTYGYALGDQVIQEVVKRIKSCLGSKDIISRLGSDEFLLLLIDTDMVKATDIADRLLASIAESFLVDDQQILLTASAGIAVFPSDGNEFDSMFKNASAAISYAKLDGRNCIRFFMPEMQAYVTRRLLLENALRKALDLNQLLLHYQPQISLHDGRTVGGEALLRWNHPELGMISPTEFIPIAESNGLIMEIGEWVLRTATHQLKAWMNAGFAPMTISVNLSAAQFCHPNLSQLVMSILNESDLKPQYLELELTETMTMDNPLKAISIMDDLYRCGIQMSIDDFGTGHSSLSHLKQFKAHKLKIDRTFVSDIAHSVDDKAIIGAVINLAENLGMQTIAEGVETEEQIRFLRENGCNEIQGHYFSQALSVEQFEKHLIGQQLMQNSHAAQLM